MRMMGASSAASSRSSTAGRSCIRRDRSTALSTSPTTAAALLETPAGTRTEAGLRQNVRVGVQYLEAWLRGTGCVPLYDLMEDAATAEISRTQIWQWVRHGTALDDGTKVTKDLVAGCLREELEKLAALGIDVKSGRFPEAQQMFFEIATSPELITFLTLPAYDALVRFEA